MANYKEGVSYKGIRNTTPSAYANAHVKVLGGEFAIIEAEEADRLMVVQKGNFEIVDQALVEEIIFHKTYEAYSSIPLAVPAQGVSTVVPLSEDSETPLLELSEGTSLLEPPVESEPPPEPPMESLVPSVLSMELAPGISASESTPSSTPSTPGDPPTTENDKPSDYQELFPIKPPKKAGVEADEPSTKPKPRYRR